MQFWGLLYYSQQEGRKFLKSSQLYEQDVCMCNMKSSYRSFFSTRKSRVRFAAVQFSSRTVNLKTLSKLDFQSYGRLRRKGFGRIANSFAVFHTSTRFVWGQHVWRNDGPLYNTISIRVFMFQFIQHLFSGKCCIIYRRPTKPPWCFSLLNNTVRRPGDNKGCNNMEKR